MKQIIFAVSLCVASIAAATAGASDVVIDVRTPEEFTNGHLKGAELIDINGSDFDAKIAKLDKNKSYKVYCRSGKRSGKAAEAMKKLGFKNVESVGGLQEASAKLGITCEGPKGCNPN